MSGSSEVVTITAKLGRDAELKYLPSGMAVLKFSLPVDKRVKSGEGWTNETLWYGVEEWGKPAEAHAELIRKGTLVTASGELQMPRVGDNGNVYLTLNARSVTLLADFGKAKQPQAERQGFDF